MKSTKKIILIASIAVVVLLSAVGIANAAVLVNTAKKAFMSPEKYYQSVELKAAEKRIEEVASLYESEFRENLKVNDKSVSTEVTLKLSSDITDLLKAATGTDLSVLEDIGFRMDSATKDEAFLAALSFLTEGESFLSGEAVLDLGGGAMFARVPELSETYLGMELDALLEEADMDSDDMKELLATLEELYEKTPDKKKVEKLLNKYAELAISCVDEVEEEKDTLTVGEVSAKCTVLTVTMKEKTVKKMAETVLEAMEKDEELETIVKEVLSVQDELDGDDVWEDFTDAISDVLDEVDDLDMDDAEIEMKVWVDKKGNICGRDFEIKTDYEEVTVSYAMPKKGKNVGIKAEAEIDDVNIKVDGSAKVKGGKLNGEVTLKAAGMKLVNISFKDLVYSGVNEMSGSFEVTLEKGLREAIENEAPPLPFDLEELALKLDVSAKKEKSSTELSLMIEEEEAICLSVVNEQKKADKLSVPTEDDAKMVEDEEDIMEYLDEIEEDALLSVLEDAGMPEELLESISELFAISRYDSARDMLYEGDYEEALAVFEAMGDYDDADYYADECRYYVALNRIEEKKYDEARDLLENLDYFYWDGEDHLQYLDAIDAYEDGAYEEALALFEEVSYLYEVEEFTNECNYQMALDYIADGYDSSAKQLLVGIGDYKDSEKLLEEIAARAPKVAVGDMVFFGRYEQDGWSGADDIEWQVLDVRNGNALLLSKYALDTREYHYDTYYNVTWEECDLRQWLNGTFYDTAFTYGEKNNIILTLNENPDNDYSGTEGGYDTYDYVFLLSTPEAETYFSEDWDGYCRARAAGVTVYAEEQDIWTSYSSDWFGGMCCYWLRTPGRYDGYATMVNAAGEIDDYAYYVNEEGTGVRPAVWVKADALTVYDQMAGDPPIYPEEEFTYRDLGGIDIVIGDWYSPEYPAEPQNAWEEATVNYRYEIMDANNFTMRQAMITSWSDMAEDCSESIIDGEPLAQVMLLDQSMLGTMISNGVCYDLATLEELDFTEEKWNRGVLEQMTFGDSIYGMAAGVDLASAYGVFWNKRLFEEAGLDPNLPYDLQASGEWTWSKFIELCDRLARDVNNDGVIDVYAMANGGTNICNGLIASTGVAPVVVTDRGNFENNLYADEVVSALEFANELAMYYEMPKPDGASWDWYTEGFGDGYAAMTFGQLYEVQNEYRYMYDDYGFVCVPKPDGADSYHTLLSETVAVIPSCYDADTAERIAYAYDLWTDPTPGYDADYTKEAMLENYYWFFNDERAVDETLTLMLSDGVGIYWQDVLVEGISRVDIGEKWPFDTTSLEEHLSNVNEDWNDLLY